MPVDCSVAAAAAAPVAGRPAAYTAGNVVPAAAGSRRPAAAAGLDTAARRTGGTAPPSAGSAPGGSAVYTVAQPVKNQHNRQLLTKQCEQNASKTSSHEHGINAAQVAAARTLAEAVSASPALVSAVPPPQASASHAPPPLAATSPPLLVWSQPSTPNCKLPQIHARHNVASVTFKLILSLKTHFLRCCSSFSRLWAST